MATSQRPESETHGWYLYGITRRGSFSAVLREADHDQGEAPLELLECSGLAAVVRRVSLAEFSAAVLQERLKSASDLEGMVRSHNRVIEVIHAKRAILPARLGMVYTSDRDVVFALRSTCETLLPQLHRVDACDEWALHLYADQTVVRERTAARTPELARLRQEHAAARPGRAYFLERQLRDKLDAATRQALTTLARDAVERLTWSAVSVLVTPTRLVANDNDEVEILRASFLVAREMAARFEDATRSVADGNEGLRCERSGPWPPYSFAACSNQEPV